MAICGIDDAGWAPSFVGRSAAFLAAVASVRRYASSRSPLLITGETGTGKEVAARAAHYLSERRDAAFIPVNCGALPEALIESELFGHARGAFTGASCARPGLVRQAEGGTLFLDEIEALSGRGQVILLRFLQDQCFRAVGEERAHRADVRVITASNVPLPQLVETGAFRADLLFRLDVLSVALPPLRERPGDVELLVPHLLEKAARAERGAAKTVSAPGLALLCGHRWPGNVRELEHVLLRAHLLSPGPVIGEQDLRRCCAALPDEGAAPDALVDRHQLQAEKLRAVCEVERRFVERALAQAHGNISLAARQCHMERASLSRLAKKYRDSGGAGGAGGSAVGS